MATWDRVHALRVIIELIKHQLTSVLNVGEILLVVFLCLPLRQNDTSPDCLIGKLTSSLLERSGEENGSVIGLLITGSGVLRLEPMTVNGCANGKSSEGRKLQHEPKPAHSAG